MKNNRYIINVVTRIVLICLTCLVLFQFIDPGNRPATMILIVILLVMQIIWLIRFHTRVLLALENFLVFLHENDTTSGYSKTSIERNFRGLSLNLDKINQKLQESRIREQQQYQYLQAIVKQVETGIIVFDHDGQIEILNSAAKQMLGIATVKNIREISLLHPQLADVLHSKARIRLPIRITVQGIERVLSFKSTTLKMSERTLKLLSFQNIRPELEAGELNAWRKLIRIQRHEIINSITPITTLTIAIKRILKRSNDRVKIEISAGQLEDALKSVDVIEDRSRGLIDFVERFRSLTDVPVLKKGDFQLSGLMERMTILFGDQLRGKGIIPEISIHPANLSLRADENLMEQVIINLVKNSIEAIDKPGGRILLEGRKDTHNRVVIRILDNGMGIDPATMDSIFIPAFTTKENGSGIGLSIIRQILQLHDAQVEIHSVPAEGTTAEITIPQ